jgi:hypothetical protein
MFNVLERGFLFADEADFTLHLPSRALAAPSAHPSSTYDPVPIHFTLGGVNHVLAASFEGLPWKSS